MGFHLRALLLDNQLMWGHVYVYARSHFNICDLMNDLHELMSIVRTLGPVPRSGPKSLTHMDMHLKHMGVVVSIRF